MSDRLRVRHTSKIKTLMLPFETHKTASGVDSRDQAATAMLKKNKSHLLKLCALSRLTSSQTNKRRLRVRSCNPRARYERLSIPMGVPEPVPCHRSNGTSLQRHFNLSMGPKQHSGTTED